jgi:branched-chain amino acid transport system permease protein
VKQRVFGGYIITVAITIGIYVILAISLNIITGYAGQISLGHAAFWGIGAYCSALLSTRLGLPFWIGLPLTIGITALVGSVLAIPCLRVREDFLAITTIGINFVVQAVFLYVPFFGGAMGIGGIRSPFGPSPFFWMTLIFVLLCIGLDRWLVRSWIGLALESLREDETAAAISGIDVVRFKVVAFAIGSGLAGLAGHLYAHFMTFISADDFGFPQSIVMVSMIVFGGIGTLRGAILGAIILGLAPELFRPVLDYRTLIYGGLLIFMMRFQPGGILGDQSLIPRIFQRLRQRGVAPIRSGV